MAFIDYYKILGVNKDIPQKDVKAAYRKRAKQFHPDLHPNDPKAKAKFQALNEAYDVIGDPEKRTKYDKYGEHWKEAEAYEQAGGGAGGFGQGGTYSGDPFEGFDFSNFGSGGSGFSSFFEDLFGGAGGGHVHFHTTGGNGRGFSGFSSGGSYGRDARYSTGEMDAKVTIPLKTALLGGAVVIRLHDGHEVKLKIKPETQPGTKVRLRGKGYDRGDGTYGDLIITYQVKLPTGLTDHQKELLNEAL
ncbi:MAG: DnaJ domain-containing protein [Prevotella sp.]|nr:DnaJ domain-containing protein [Prevotella sp.]